MISFSGFVANLNINFGRTISDRKISFGESDKKLAWKIYIELVTRVALQPLSNDEGDEKAALSSLHQFFTITRELMREEGPEAIEATRLGIFVLNEVIRPFTGKWHKISQTQGFDHTNKDVFRAELKELQKSLKGYASSLMELLEIKDGLEF